MKIVQVIGSCLPGGAEIFVKELSKELKNKGIDLEIWVLSKINDIAPNDNKKINFEKNFVKELEKANIMIKFVDKKPKRDWKKTKKILLQFYNEFKPNIIHSHLESVTFHVCRALGGKIPIIQTIHNVKISYPILQRLYIKNKLNAFVAISKKVKKVIIDKIRPEKSKIYTIYNGINISKFRNSRLINQNVKKIIAIGRLTKQKDYPNLFKALKFLKSKLLVDGKRLPNVKIVGAGKLENKLKKLIIKEGIDEIVKFLGIREDIPELLADSDIYVMSSEWEGLSISLIEALASGIPIVATDAGSNSEIVDSGKNGLIVPIKNPVALSNALYYLINNYEIRQKFSKEAFKKSRIFSLENCAEKHLEMYQEVLNG